MFTRHVSRQLAAHLDGQLADGKAQHVGRHLEKCELCRAEREEVRQGMAMVELLPRFEAPEEIWPAIEAAFDQNRSHQAAAVPRWRWALAAALVLALGGATYWHLAHSPGMRWEVVRQDGSGQIGAGEWIETDARSHATLKVGEIGFVEVTPNTRVRVVTARRDEHRLALARGEIRARISAPPKLFFVDTASGTAVDLGCEYALKTDESGSGWLHVTRGWVSFQWKGLESLVPAGASCRTRPQAGPGIPYFDDAPDSLRQAVESFGFEKAGNDALSVVLSQARVRDTLTLWHLLSRVEGSDRERVFDRIAALTPLPAGVSREQALRLDPQTLNRWREELAWTW